MTINPLDRSSPLPLWAQLEAELRRRLESGEFENGFPTDLQLTETYEVSRHTVREAVRHLNKTGVLKRERGRGTVVNRTEFEQSLGTLYSLFQSVEATGVEQTSRVLRLEIVTDTIAANQLELPDDAEFVLLERIRLAGGAPLAVDRGLAPRDFRPAAARRRLRAHRTLRRAGQVGRAGSESGMGAIDAHPAQCGRSKPPGAHQVRRRVLSGAPWLS